MLTILSIYGSSPEFVIYTPDGYYMSTKHGVDGVHFIKEGKVYLFDQFDLKYNRPDIILKRLGYASADLIDAYYKAYQKRIKKMGFKEKDLEGDFHIPQSKIINFEYMPIIEEKDIQIDLNFNDSKYKLDRYNVWVNNVPIYGMNGKSLKSFNISQFATTENIVLTEGDNQIQVSCLNEKGAESYKEMIKLKYEPKKPVKPNLYIVTISVSEYQNQDFNLKYAVKDGRDLVNALTQQNEGFDKIIVDTLFNTDANRENILSLKEKLLNTANNDQIILFVSGHGLLDEDYNFWFATHDMDFDNPAKRGVSYDEIEWLLDSIPARKKLLLMDACHSGEVDVEAMKQAEKDIFENDSNSMVKEVVFKGAYNTKRPKLGLQNSFELMQELFVNLNRGSGAQVISAAAGNSYALESDKWQNGVFTYSILSGLENYAADLNGDKIITVSELRKYVGDKVVELTNGAQKPTSRQENVVNDFRVW
jgi:hypothetical protein